MSLQTALNQTGKIKLRLITGVLLPVFATIAAADPITVATGVNTTIGSSQLVNTATDLIVHQAAPNFTYATAQPVSPQYMASDILGSITNSITQEFFAFPLNNGDTISLFVKAGTPATQFPALLLFEKNQNLIAIADGNAPDNSSSQLDFTVPPGEDGNWTAEVAGSPGAPDPSHNFFNYDLRLTGSAIRYTIDVLGALTDPTKHGFYAISTNAGDNLHLEVQTGTPATGSTELLLFDGNGNLVAIADGNAPDGSSSILDFTIPSGDAGNWVAEVAGSAGAPDPNKNLFNYDLQIQGATGTGPVDPLPEPSTLVLTAIALAGLAFIRRS